MNKSLRGAQRLHYLRKFLLLGILILMFIRPAEKGQSKSTVPFEWRIGEELVYKVKWSFLRLGTLRLHVKDTIQYNGLNVYHVILKIDSNPMLFFVDMHNRYESYIDREFYIYRHRSNERVDGKPFRTDHQFNYADSTVTLTMSAPTDSTERIVKKLPLKRRLFDGITMTFYARANAHRTTQDTLNTFILEERGKVAVHFHGRKEEIEIDAHEEPLKAYYLDGHIDVEGIAGVTGPFKGWFADDWQRPPLKAELKVFIGHVSVELERWKRWSMLSN